MLRRPEAAPKILLCSSKKPGASAFDSQTAGLSMLNFTQRWKLPVAFVEFYNTCFGAVLTRSSQNDSEVEGFLGIKRVLQNFYHSLPSDGGTLALTAEQK